MQQPLDYKAALANYMALDAEEKRTRRAIAQLEAKLANIETSKDMAFNSNTRALQRDQVQTEPKIVNKPAPEVKEEPKVVDGPMPAEELFRFSDEAAEDVAEEISA